MRTAIYIRVSTGKQDADNQLRALKEYANSQGWEIAAIYEDVASGGDMSRPAFERLFMDAHKAAFDTVLFWALDRFSRSGTLYTLQKLKELENLKIGWHSYQEAYFSTIGQFKDVVLSIMATVAKLERERISERTKAAINKPGVRERVGKRGKDKKPRSKKGYFK